MGKTNHYKHKEFIEERDDQLFCNECQEYIEDSFSGFKLDTLEPLKTEIGNDTHLEAFELTEEQEMAAELKAEMGATRG